MTQLPLPWPATQPLTCRKTWGAQERTMPTAHQWLMDHFDQVTDGDVIDVEFILGESATPKTSEYLD